LANWQILGINSKIGKFRMVYCLLPLTSPKKLSGFFKTNILNLFFFTKKYQSRIESRQKKKAKRKKVFKVIKLSVVDDPGEIVNYINSYNDFCSL